MMNSRWFLIFGALACVAYRLKAAVFNDVDVVIAGGSLSALAAAITAANLSLHNSPDAVKRIVLLEPTDWPGGQLTSSNVPPDFGKENSVPENLPAAFVQLLLAVAGPSWSSNPGLCWVSYKCFEAHTAAQYIRDWLASFNPVLEVYYNTVVASATVSRNDDQSNLSQPFRIDTITAIQRTAKPGFAGYEKSYSMSVEDWYSAHDSDLFAKETLVFRRPKVVIDASEYLDVLTTSGMELSQGVEVPDELSNSTNSGCGQSTVLPFYMAYNDSRQVAAEDVPQGSDNGIPFSMQGLSWGEIWSYRRAKGLREGNAVTVGEQSNQNLDNDYRGGYLFLSVEAVQQQITENKYCGGLNLTSVYAAEQRAYGWYHYLKSQANSSGVSADYIYFNKTQTGTGHGLAKMPYLRDTRRSKWGLEQFRLTYADLNYSNPADNGQTARPFPDTVAIGVYLYADIHSLAPQVCSYPSYITCCSHPVKPYYVPFRALTHIDVSNVLVPGKGMAQSFLANAATRLHPVEFGTGVAAGAAAHIMVVHAASSVRFVYEHIDVLQQLLLSESVRSPLTWTLPVGR